MSGFISWATSVHICENTKEASTVRVQTHMHNGKFIVQPIPAFEWNGMQSTANRDYLGAKLRCLLLWLSTQSCSLLEALQLFSCPRSFSHIRTFTHSRLTHELRLLPREQWMDFCSHFNNKKTRIPVRLCHFAMTNIALVLSNRFYCQKLSIKSSCKHSQQFDTFRYSLSSSTSSVGKCQLSDACKSRERRTLMFGAS